MTASQVLAESQRVDLALLKHLRPFIFGSKAILHRYSQNETTSAGLYNKSLATQYPWSGKEDDSIVDQSYTRVFIKNGLLKYFEDLTGAGQTIAPVSGYTNRVRCATLAFKTANDVDRSAAFYDRDVALNDIVYVRGTVSAVVYEHWSSVAGFVAEKIAAVTGTATSDANNLATQSLDVNIEQVDGTPVNDVVATASAASYHSFADGYLNRTYTITCTQGSTGGDASTALLSVTSADGLDNQTNVVPAAFGAPTSIGTKGLTVTFDIDPGNFSASSSSVDEDDFLVGQQWTVVVEQDFTAPTPTASGTYTGPSDTTYRVEVTLGGKYADSTKPQITVSTTTGIDSSGPTDVTATATNVAIGTQGIQIQFSQTGLRKGDIYYVPVTAQADGAVRTILLKNPMPSGLLPATDLDLKLFILKPEIELSERRTAPTSGYNWTQDADDGVTVDDGIQLTDSTLTDDGDPVYVPLESGNTTYGEVHLEWREWDVRDSLEVINLTSRDQVEDALGLVTPDNPIAFAADLALQNTATAVLDLPNPNAPTYSDKIKVCTLGGDPALEASWTEALEVAAGLDEVYYLVPLTDDPAIQDLVVAHVQEQSTISVPNYRACLLAGSVEETLAVVDATTSSDEETVLATLAIDPGDSTYTLINVTSGNSQFITDGVRAGDTVRYQYGVDAFGDDTYTEYVVEEVLSETGLKLVEGYSGAIATPQRLEVWRTPTKAELVAQLTDRAEAIADRRVCLVWPDEATVDGEEVAGHFVCSAVAGLAGSVASHQGLRNVQLLGFDSFARSREFFRTANLDAAGAGGVFVLATTEDGTNYVRWAHTTDVSETKYREEMVRRNTDCFTLQLLKEDWGSFIGSANISQFLAALMRAAFTNMVNRMLRTTTVNRLGPMVDVATIDSLERSATYPDRMTATITFSGPYPDNLNELTLII